MQSRPTTAESAWVKPRWRHLVSSKSFSSLTKVRTSEAMHELSIAMSIVELAEEEAERRGVQVEAVHLKLGALSGVVKDALLSCYEMACEGTPLAGSRLLIEESSRRDLLSQLSSETPTQFTADVLLRGLWYPNL